MLGVKSWHGPAVGEGAGTVTAVAWMEAMVWVQSLAWECPYAMGLTPQKRKERKKERRKE